MSNATQQEGRSGNRNRNRSRGGKGRNQGQNRNNQNRNQSRDYSPGDYAGRPRNPRPQPVKLSWWQKLLKLIGLYKAPQQPERSFGPQKPKQAVRSNTRVATGAEGGSQYQREPREAREPVRTEVDSPRLYVGNLSYEATESDLEDLFKGVGTVRNIEVIYNRNTHRSKGYAFVEMLHLDEAKRAVEVLHDQPFMGRKLLVSGAKSKEASDDEASRSGPSED